MAGVTSVPYKDTLNTNVLVDLREMWETAVKCGGGSIPAVLSQRIEDNNGLHLRGVEYLNDIRDALKDLINHTITVAALKHDAGNCCEDEVRDWVKYTADNSGVEFPAELSGGITEDTDAATGQLTDWYDKISTIIARLKLQIYTSTGCPTTCFQETTTLPPQCLTVTGNLCVDPDSGCMAVKHTSPDYDSTYDQWTGILKWVNTEWVYEDCFADSALDIIKSEGTTYGINAFEWRDFETSGCVYDPVVDEWRSLNGTNLVSDAEVFVKLYSFEGSQYYLEFWAECFSILLWKGCKEGGEGPLGTYNRIDGRDTTNLSMLVETSECPIEGCPCESQSNWDDLADGTIEECGGLKSDYNVDNDFTSPYDPTSIFLRIDYDDGSWEEYRVNTTCLVEASSLSGTCLWADNVNVVEYRESADPTTWTCCDSLSLILGSCAWLMSPSGAPGTVELEKDTGQTPVGTYTKNQYYPSLGWTVTGSAVCTEATS